MIGAWIGKLSPPHNGHVDFIEFAYNQVDSILFLVGGANKYSIKYPFSYEERIEMLKAMMNECFSGKSYSYGPIQNVKGDDQSWFNNIINSYRFDVVFTGNPHTIAIFKSNGVPTITHNLEEKISSTNIREGIMKGEDYSNLVPNSVYNILEKMNIRERLTRLYNKEQKSELYSAYVGYNNKFRLDSSHNLSSKEEFIRMINSLNPFLESHIGCNIAHKVYETQDVFFLKSGKSEIEFARLEEPYLHFCNENKLSSILANTYSSLIKEILVEIEKTHQKSFNFSSK